jgi:hypothetical protein
LATPDRSISRQLVRCIRNALNSGSGEEGMGWVIHRFDAQPEWWLRHAFRH